jgi:hypothetical protein
MSACAARSCHQRLYRPVQDSERRRLGIQVGVFACSGCLVLVAIFGCLFPVVQQQEHVSPLPLRDLGRACDVVSDPLFAGDRFCGRRAVVVVVVRWFVLGSVARAASPPPRWLWVAMVVVRPFVRPVCMWPYTRRREGRGRTNGRLQKVTGGTLGRTGNLGHPPARQRPRAVWDTRPVSAH